MYLKETNGTGWMSVYLDFFAALRYSSAIGKKEIKMGSDDLKNLLHEADPSGELSFDEGMINEDGSIGDYKALAAHIKELFRLYYFQWDERVNADELRKMISIPQIPAPFDDASSLSSISDALIQYTPRGRMETILELRKKNKILNLSIDSHRMHDGQMLVAKTADVIVSDEA